jgi:signal transduction histidine kinase
MHSLLVNLVENALDACRVDRGKTEHRVLVSGRRDAEHLLLEVADNGIGMERVFLLVSG